MWNGGKVDGGVGKTGDWLIDSYRLTPTETSYGRGKWGGGGEGGGYQYLSSLAANDFRTLTRPKTTTTRTIYIKMVGNSQVLSNSCTPQLNVSTVVSQRQCPLKEPLRITTEQQDKPQLREASTTVHSLLFTQLLVCAQDGGVSSTGLERPISSVLSTQGVNWLCRSRVGQSLSAGQVTGLSGGYKGVTLEDLGAMRVPPVAVWKKRWPSWTPRLWWSLWSLWT